MATKIFCDWCGKEIKKHKAVRVWNVPTESGFDFYEFCPECWKKNWRPEKKQDS